MTSETGRTAGLSRVSLRRRLALLAGCLGLGLGIGYVGWQFSADDRWFLALPIVLALGWLAVADPERCVSAADRPAAPNPPKTMPTRPRTISMMRTQSA
jgi:hypothetical protein